MSDLIERLRSNYPKGGMFPSVYEAADTLEAQAKRITELEAALAAVTAERDVLKVDAERYRFWRDNIDFLLADDDGLAGMAFSFQIPFTEIDAKSDAELFDAIADAAIKEQQP